MSLPDGWLSEQEADELRSLASGGRVLELGSWKGRSTIVMAEVAELIVSVDRHLGIGSASDPAPSLYEYLDNISGHANVVPVIADWAKIYLMFSNQFFDLIFVDGDHDAASVQRDFEIAMALQKEGSVIAGHDWDFDSVREGVRLAGLDAPTRVTGSVAVWV